MKSCSGVASSSLWSPWQIGALHVRWMSADF
jgi:hypothetical protein